MFDDLRQFVVDSDCRACRECCIFRDPQGVWQPHVLPDESRGLRQLIPPVKFSPDGRKIIIEKSPKGQKCSCLDDGDYFCCIYANRPLECRLYPFVISREGTKLRLYAHLACPVIQDKLHSREGAAYLSYLKEHLSSSEALATLRGNFSGFPDYSSAAPETEWCFDILGKDPLLYREEIDRRFRQKKALLAAQSFINLFTWKDFFDFCVEDINGSLCVFADQPAGTFLYWPPLGPSIDDGTVDQCFLKMRERNQGGSLTRVENVSRHDLPAFDPARYSAHLQGHDYIYYRQDIVDLKGDDYKSRRHDLNQLLRKFKVKYRPFLLSDVEACSQLFDRWLDKRRCQHEDVIYRYMLEDSRSVHRLLMESTEILGLTGRVVDVDGHLSGYTFGHALSEDVFCDLIEVADPDVSGLSAFLFREFCADEAVKPFKFVNAMDDFGMLNVSRGKMLYRPAFLEPIYSVTERTDV